MNAKHTPGPWYFDADTGRVREHASDAVVAHLSDGEHVDPDIELFDAGARAKHGRLIAAAPELLVALTDLIAPWNEGRRFVDMDADEVLRLFHNARAALAKARGET